jgi:membrane-associated phospholipid phosphatase
MVSDKAGRINQRGVVWGLLVCVVVFILCYFAIVNTPWGHALDDAVSFGRKALSPKIVTLNARFLDLVTKSAVLAAAGILILVAMARRCILVGVIAVIGFASAVVGAEVFKETLPWRALIPEDRFLESTIRVASYPSGHASIGTAFALGLLLVSSARWRPWLGIAAGGLSSLFAAGVLFAGWHRWSDAIGALAWSGCCMNLAALIAIRLRGHPSAPMANAEHAIFGSIGFGILVVAGSWLAACTVGPGHLHAILPFFASTNLVIATAFLLTAWYGWQLRAVDWTADRTAKAGGRKAATAVQNG